MTQWITATFEHGVLVPAHDVDLRERQTVRLEIVPPRARVTATAAQRHVNRFLLDQVSYLMGTERPVLTEAALPRAAPLVWRVPVVLTNPTDGPLGQVGTVDVDAETGELLVGEHTAEILRRHGRALAAGFAAEATP